MPHQPLAVVVGERPVPQQAKLHDHPGGLVETRSRDLEQVLSGLFGRGIRRVYVEGGAGVASALVASGLVDEYSVYLAPTLLGGGHAALGDIGVGSIGEQRRLDIIQLEQLGGDILVTARAVRARSTIEGH